MLTSVTVCCAGATPFAAPVKLNDVGDALITKGVAFTVNVAEPLLTLLTELLTVTLNAVPLSPITVTGVV